MPERLEFGRTIATPHGSGKWDVAQLPALQHMAQHQPAATHVSPTHEIARKKQPPIEETLQDLHIFVGSDAAEKDDAVAFPECERERARIALQGPAVARLVERYSDSGNGAQVIES